MVNMVLLKFIQISIKCNKFSLAPPQTLLLTPKMMLPQTPLVDFFMHLTDNTHSINRPRSQLINCTLDRSSEGGGFNGGGGGKQHNNPPHWSEMSAMAQLAPRKLNRSQVNSLSSIIYQISVQL